MGAEALESAVFNWAQRRGVDLKALGVDIHADEIDEGRVVCKCFSLTEPYIRRKVKELGLKTIAEITNAIKAGGACMACHHKPGGLQDILNETWGTAETRFKEATALDAAGGAAPGDAPSPYQLGRHVDQVMESHIRPMLRKDGGDAEIVDIKEFAVYVKLVGACAGCAGAMTTLKLLVEKTLKEQIDERMRVVAVGGTR